MAGASPSSRMRRLTPGGSAVARRSHAVIRLAESYDDGVVEELEDVAREYAGMELRFDAARSLLALGRSLRRHRKWGAARRTLLLAADAFDELGSHGWAVLAGPDVERVGARRPPPEGVLSPAERRVAELAAEAREQGDRPGARGHRQHGRVPPLEDLREAGDPLARPARGTPPGRGRRARDRGP